MQNQSVSSLNELLEFVHHTLCENENLLTEQFQTVQSELISRGKPCGIQFHLHGPRSVRLGAIWAADTNEVYFYNARGQRFLKVKLLNRFALPSRSAG